MVSDLSRYYRGEREPMELEKADRQQRAAERRLQAPHSDHSNRVEDSGLGGRESIIGTSTCEYELTRSEPPGSKPNSVWSIGTENCAYLVTRIAPP